jgi:HJR/Mrr/RecB family endonuclease
LACRTFVPRGKSVVFGSISQREFTKGIIITNSGFTSAARQEAKRLGVEVYEGV